MEDRTLLATFTVINTNDSGDGSLRQALANAYDSYSQGDTNNTLDFNVPATDPGKDPVTGAFVIRPLSTLGFSDPLVIDGYSQPGSSRNTLAVGDNAVLRIELDGSQAGDGRSGLYLNHTDNCTVEGLDIHSYSGPWDQHRRWRRQCRGRQLHRHRCTGDPGTGERGRRECRWERREPLRR